MKLDSYAQSPGGLVYLANGLENLQRWDGLAASTVDAGVHPPLTPLTLAKTGTGNIVGTYRAYFRFVDNLGNFSDLSPVSADLVATSAALTITDATHATPIVIATSAAHGVTTGARVLVAGVGGNTGANGSWLATAIDATHLSLQGSSGNGDYTGGGTLSAGVASITYSALPGTNGNTNLARRQILRNTDGQATTYYVDVDSTDLGAVSFVTTKDDVQLAAGLAVPLLDENKKPLANVHGYPPNHKASLAHHLGRMFFFGEETYSDGMVQVTNGSPTVVGVGTAFPSALAGRYLYVAGAAQTYQIQAVVDGTHLTLLANYADATDKFAGYAISPPPGERRLGYYSEAGLPESVPATNALEVQEDGDELVGCMTKGSFVYFIERGHVYKFTFQADPAVDGFTFLSLERGCVNRRCWVKVEDRIYMLDEQGVHAFAGGQDTEPVSQFIQRLFRPGEGEKSINWRVSKTFFGVHYPTQETIRWFVALSGCYLPQHALCYQYRTKHWWIEEFPVPVSAGAVGRLNGPVVFLGSEGARVLGFWRGTLDGPDASAGTVRGTVSSAGRLWLEDNTASFPPAGVVNAPLVIVAGTGKGQRRQINRVAGVRLYVDEPFLQRPDTTSVYQIGGISWRYLSRTFRYVEDEEENPRRVEMLFQPCKAPCSLDLRLYRDLSDTPQTWGSTYSSDEAQGVSSQANSADLVVDLTKPLGFAQKRFASHRERGIDGKRFVTLELAGVTNQDVVTVYQVAVEGVA